jgi:hypothetical protein
MKMHLLHRAAMHLAFSLRNQLIYRHNMLLDRIRNRQMRNDFRNFCHTGMMVMRMLIMMMMAVFFVIVMMAMLLVMYVFFVIVVMRMFLAICMLFVMMVVFFMVQIMTFLFNATYLDLQMQAMHAAGCGILRRNLHPRNAKLIHLVYKCLLIRQQLHQCRKQHIACCPHITF